jgi:hypothetical protein
MLKLSLLLVSAFASTSQAFVVRSSNIKSPARGVEIKRDMVFDPSHIFETASTFLADAAGSEPKDFIAGTSGEVSYSRASYYTILGLYLVSFPGLWSTIKRSTSAKMKSKTFVR